MMRPMHRFPELPEPVQEKLALLVNTIASHRGCYSHAELAADIERKTSELQEVWRLRLLAASKSRIEARERVKKTTRAGKAGKVLVCPECEWESAVSHFGWTAKTCVCCHEMVEKTDWRLAGRLVEDDDWDRGWGEYDIVGTEACFTRDMLRDDVVRFFDAHPDITKIELISGHYLREDLGLHSD